MAWFSYICYTLKIISNYNKGGNPISCLIDAASC